MDGVEKRQKRDEGDLVTQLSEDTMGDDIQAPFRDYRPRSKNSQDTPNPTAPSTTFCRIRNLEITGALVLPADRERFPRLDGACRVLSA